MKFKQNFGVFLITALCVSGGISAAYAAVSRAVPVADNSSDNSVSRTINSSRTVVATPSTTETSKISRSINSGATTSTNVVSRSAVSNVSAAASRSGMNPRVAESSINNTAAAKRAGVNLRASVAEVGGRATIGDTGVQTGSNVNFDSARNVSARSAVDMTAVENLSAVSDLNKSCQTQYNECMDQFCSVVDENQQRCSCSANLENYSDVEEAVKNANDELNEVAQRIRYVGLSADEIRAIMTETEAEEVLSTTTDNTESRSMLDDIKDLIENPTVSFNTSSNSFGLDLDFDFSGDSADLFNLDFLNSSTNNFSNLRGSALRDAAKKSCSTILTQCTAAGADEDQIVGNYDLAIDRDCLAYEAGLIKMNDTLKSNVRAATQMLQQARLAVLENENIYDTKACIGALETCMSDDMVCGTDYEKCIDPTKKYIDENGDVVLGENISKITYFMSDYDNAAITEEFLSDNANVSSCGTDGDCIVAYLLNKIGTGATAQDGGLCRAVMDKCKRSTYTEDDEYMPYNEVVLNYIQRAMVNIKADQQQIISDYASSCLLDVASCYNQQVSQVNSWTTSASVGNIYNVMRGACRNVALTCSYAIFAYDDESCPSDTTAADMDTCINSISEIFYQSLLCPSNSMYVTEPGDVGVNGYVNQHCKCAGGYQYWNTICIASCGPGEELDSLTGLCEDIVTEDVEECQEGYQEWNGDCVPDCGQGQELNETTGECQNIVIDPENPDGPDTPIDPPF